MDGGRWRDGEMERPKDGWMDDWMESEGLRVDGWMDGRTER